MWLVELIRLVIVLALTAIGFQLGRNPSGVFQTFERGELTPALFAVVGAGIGYVFGGVLGRLLRGWVGVVERRAEAINAAEILIGTLGVLVGVGAALLLSWPVFLFVSPDLAAFSIAALLVILLSYTGFRIAGRKRFDILGMMGLSERRALRASVGRTALGARVLDSSALIDGRILDVARSGFLAGHVVCPRFVLQEIQSIADSSDAVRRSRGRRGLEVLEALEGDPRIRLEVTEDQIPEIEDVDAKLVALVKRIGGVLVTTDFNLHRVAELQGVPVLNVNSLAASLRPPVMAGEIVEVSILREGTREGQGVGYLDDGTMVVVEGAAELVGSSVSATITSMLQTNAGRMLFASLGGEEETPAAPREG